MDPKVIQCGAQGTEMVPQRYPKGDPEVDRKSVPKILGTSGPQKYPNVEPKAPKSDPKITCYFYPH